MNAARRAPNASARAAEENRHPASQIAPDATEPIT